jgi:hypothetical protein
MRPERKGLSGIFALCAFLAYMVFTNPQNPYSEDAWKLVTLIVLGIIIDMLTGRMRPSLILLSSEKSIHLASRGHGYCSSFFFFIYNASRPVRRR